MVVVKKIPYNEKYRVETGPIQFGDDYYGIFLRGQDALYYAHILDGLLKGDNDSINKNMLEGFVKILRECYYNQ